MDMLNMVNNIYNTKVVGKSGYGNIDGDGDIGIRDERVKISFNLY